jgi:hypothetical protein
MIGGVIEPKALSYRTSSEVCVEEANKAQSGFVAEEMKT